MKKYFLLLPCFALSAVLAQSQSQSGASSSGQAGLQTSGQPSGQTGAAQNNNLQPKVPGTVPGAGNIPNDPAGANRVSGVTPGGVSNVPFGGTNQIRFGATNTGRFINDPSGANARGPAQFGGTNPVQFAPNQGTGLPTNNTPTAGSGTIQEPSGAANPNNPAGTVLPNGAAAADAAFAQQMNAALARGGATRIFFPQTRSTITLVNQNGSILLTGFVADEAERRNIEARVKNAAGVTSVENRLQIGTGQNRAINPGQNPPAGTGTENQRQLLNP
jgi:hypothetical protein